MNDIWDHGSFQDIPHIPIQHVVRRIRIDDQNRRMHVMARIVWYGESILQSGYSAAMSQGVDCNAV